MMAKSELMVPVDVAPGEQPVLQAVHALAVRGEPGAGRGALRPGDRVRADFMHENDQY